METKVGVLVFRRNPKRSIPEFYMIQKQSSLLKSKRWIMGFPSSKSEESDLDFFDRAETVVEKNLGCDFSQLEFLIRVPPGKVKINDVRIVYFLARANGQTEFQPKALEIASVGWKSVSEIFYQNSEPWTVPVLEHFIKNRSFAI